MQRCLRPILQCERADQRSSGTDHFKETTILTYSELAEPFEENWLGEPIMEQETVCSCSVKKLRVPGIFNETRVSTDHGAFRRLLTIAGCTPPVGQYRLRIIGQHFRATLHCSEPGPVTFGRVVGEIPIPLQDHTFQWNNRYLIVDTVSAWNRPIRFRNMILPLEEEVKAPRVSVLIAAAMTQFDAMAGSFTWLQKDALLNVVLFITFGPSLAWYGGNPRRKKRTRTLQEPILDGIPDWPVYQLSKTGRNFWKKLPRRPSSKSGC